jgi:hypothetical protein
MEYEARAYQTSWRSNRAAIHRAELEPVCWFVAIGLSLTVLFFALGYAESIGQALALAG